jgi:hypothetical protein
MTWQVSLGASDTVEAALSPANEVERLVLRTSGVATAEGARVGSPIVVLLRLDDPVGEVIEGEVFLSVQQHCGVFFVRQISGRETGDRLVEAELYAQLRDSTIDRIEVHKC